ncbi:MULTISPECIES: hypothetical protein [unclassified Pseudomonas]|uniref:hypothetical protein n=1 Tax=unclassified Pseudomonas TaxID=196821 RepID=UPI00249C4C15|nr:MULTISPECIES: hypothetical protein [unclassified Pseudomonas]
MTAWRNQSFKGKVGILAWLGFLLLISGDSEPCGLGSESSNRKRVFSPGFIVLCIFVALIELIALNHFFGVQGIS